MSIPAKFDLRNDDINQLPSVISLPDHLGGFDLTGKSLDLTELAKTNRNITVNVEYIVDQQIRDNYANLDLKFNCELWASGNHVHKFTGYRVHPAVNYRNFVCSFNGSNHVGRQLLASALQKFGYFDQSYCSKNFGQTGTELEGHIENYVENTNFYNKFFDCTDLFNQHQYSFGHVRYEHDKNIYNLENKLTESFVNIVSETMPTSYYPFVTEKALYSIVTRGLFLAYAQPGWHEYIEKYLGFKLYTKLFDYRFDTVVNPVERLVELMTMISKFSKLTPYEWYDLYLLESDTVEYNYNHYFSNDYLRKLQQLDNTSET